jgi:hypothetical protein
LSMAASRRSRQRQRPTSDRRREQRQCTVVRSRLKPHPPCVEGERSCPEHRQPHPLGEADPHDAATIELKGSRHE